MRIMRGIMSVVSNVHLQVRLHKDRCIFKKVIEVLPSMTSFTKRSDGKEVIIQIKRRRIDSPLVEKCIFRSLIKGLSSPITFFPYELERKIIM